MRTSLIIVMFSFLVSGCASVGTSWSTRDKILEGSYLATHAVDYYQTRQHVADQGCTVEQQGNIRRKTCSVEGNPILGPSPSPGEINSYFLLTGLSHMAITHFLPKDWRTLWGATTLSIQLTVISSNASK